MLVTGLRRVIVRAESRVRQSSPILGELFSCDARFWPSGLALPLVAFCS